MSRVPSKARKPQLIRTGFDKSAFSFDPADRGVKVWNRPEGYAVLPPYFDRLYYVEGRWIRHQGTESEPATFANEIFQGDALSWFHESRMDVPPELEEYAHTPSWNPGSVPFVQRFAHLEAKLKEPAQAPADGKEGTFFPPEVKDELCQILKGKERALVELLIASPNGVPLEEIAAQKQISWSLPCDDAFNSARKRINKKLRPRGYGLQRHDNNARIVRIGRKKD